MQVILEVWEDGWVKGDSLCVDSHCLAGRHFNSQDKTGLRDRESHLQGRILRAGRHIEDISKRMLVA